MVISKCFHEIKKKRKKIEKDNGIAVVSVCEHCKQGFGLSEFGYQRLISTVWILLGAELSRGSGRHRDDFKRALMWSVQKLKHFHC